MPSSSISERVRLPLFAGVDIGGTNIKIGLVDNEGEIIASARFPTQRELGPQHAIDQVRNAFDTMMGELPFSWSNIEAVGIGTPGPIDIARGLILTPSNLPTWHHFPIRRALASALNKKVTFGNDAAAAAYGEFWVGAGRDHDSTVLITLGTGVGGGIIINNQSIDGEHSHGAEVGHIVIDTSDSARMCGCGRRGHLEAYVSATAIVARTRENLAGWPKTVLTQRIDEASPLSALMVSEAAAAGDKLACQIVEETAIYLGRGITILAHVIDPFAFFLGGAVDFGGAETELGKRFLELVAVEVRKNSFPVIAEQLTIEFAQLGSEAGFVGAAGLARTELLNKVPPRS